MQKIVWDKPKLYIGDKLVEDTISTLSLESIPFEEPEDNIDISNLTFTCEVVDLNYDALKSFLFKEKNLRREIKKAWIRQDYLWLAMEIIQVAITYQLMMRNPMQSKNYRYALELYKRKPRKYTYRTLKSK